MQRLYRGRNYPPTCTESGTDPYEHQIGHRICAWIDRALSNDAEASTALDQIRDELGKCLDVLVRSGIASARALEARIVDEGTPKRTA